MTVSRHDGSADAAKGSLSVLALSALGVVFGDLGTSPLYTLQTVVNATGGHFTAESALGVLSLVFWTLIVTISVKYCLFVMRANNGGEGGILALMSLVGADTLQGRTGVFTALGLVGAALIYGDGVITPAISVLSALDGVKVATPALTPFIMPAAVVILLMLFGVQHLGTARIGGAFGPVMLVWFGVIGWLGMTGVVQHPAVLWAIDPTHALHFLLTGGAATPLVLGGVFLCATGGEALYADMGHFGKGPINGAWFVVVLPALLLSYAGQTALMMEHGAFHGNPFYQLAPPSAVYPLVGLATLATIIASQSIITGAYSMTRQAIQLGWLPAMTIRQTSSRAYGQIYVPAINRAMMAATIAITIGFGSSDRLAGAYGTAVSTTMLLTTCLLFLAMTRVWRWPMALVAPLIGLFLVVDFSFFAANLLKIADGGWLPLSIGALLFLTMTTWRFGIDTIRASVAQRAQSVTQFREALRAQKTIRAPGAAIFPTRSGQDVPPSVVNHVRDMRSLYETVIILTVEFAGRPTIDADERIEVTEDGDGLWRVTARFGFMDTPDLPGALSQAEALKPILDLGQAIYIVSHDRVSPSRRDGPIRRMRAAAFGYLERNAQRVEDRFHLPSPRVIEVWREVKA